MVEPARREARGAVARIALAALVVGLALQAVAVVHRCWETRHANPLDLAMRWTTANLLLDGENPYAMRRARTASPRLRELEREALHFDPNYLPSSLTPLLPYALLPFRPAVTAWFATNLLGAAALVWLVLGFAHPGREDPWLRALAVAAFAAGAPFQIALANGQNPVVALALFVASVEAAQRSRTALAVALLALSMFKYHLILPIAVPLLLAWGHWRILLACGLLHGVAHVAWSAAIGSSPLAVAWDVFQINRESLAYRGHDVWSLGRALDRALGLDLHPWPSALAVMALLAAAAAALGARPERGDRRDALRWMGALALLSLALAYHRPYDFVCLLLPLLWVAAPGPEPALRLAVAGGIGFLFLGGLLTSPLGSFAWWTKDADWLLQVFALHLAILGALGLAAAERIRRQALAPPGRLPTSST